MCGVFGFVSRNDGHLDIKTLRKIAVVTEQRGPHAWGMAWIDRAGELHMYKQTGKISDSLHMLKIARDAVMLIGHCRWATAGDPERNHNNHPHSCDGGWYVHNGVIPHYRQLIGSLGLKMQTECDSEVLGLLMQSQPTEKRIDRAVYAAEVAGVRPLVMMGLWEPGELIIIRKGNPLHIGRTKRGVYFGSLAMNVPNAELIKDNTARRFVIDKTAGRLTLNG